MTVGICLAAAAIFAGGHPPQRALWVWHGHPLLESSTERHKFFDFLSAPKGNPSSKISVIFLARVGIENPLCYGSIRSLVSEAHRRSIRVDYLCGEANYATDSHMREGLWQLEYVARYNSQVAPKERLDGIQYDVEPYMNPGWPSKRLLASYKRFLTISGRHARSRNLKLGAAIPRWFDDPKLQGLYKAVLDRVDYVAVMDYVDGPGPFVADARNTVRYASRVGKQAWLGAEVSELPDEPRATFYRLGNAALENTFQAAYDAYRSAKGFAGVAVEYYETYASLKP